MPAAVARPSRPMGGRIRCDRAGGRAGAVSGGDDARPTGYPDDAGGMRRLWTTLSLNVREGDTLMIGKPSVPIVMDV